MITFNYKGFINSYDIKKLSEQHYIVEGEVRPMPHSPSSSIRLDAESISIHEAQKKIIKLIEKYVDSQCNYF